MKRAEMGTAGTSFFNLGPRLTLIFVALIALILGGNALVISQFHIARNDTDRLTGANQELIAVLQLQANLLSFHRRLDDLARSMDVRRLVTEAQSLRSTLQQQTQQTRIAIANLPSETVVDRSFLPTLNSIEVTMPSELDGIVALAKSGDWGLIQSRLGNELQPIETETAILVNSINLQASGELTRGVAEMRTVELRILIFVSATALLTFCIAALFGWSIARRIIELHLDARVEERMRIARELHDTLLQSFQGVLMKFEVATDMLPDKVAEARKMLSTTNEQARKAIIEGRELVHGLRASTVIRNELASAIGTLGKELSAASSDENCCDFHLLVEGTSRDIVPIIRDEIYRIACEALRNAFKHAHARRIEVELYYDPRKFRLRVCDNGNGIDPKLLAEGGRSQHYGLPGMQERARLVKGKLTVLSSPESGTEIELIIPAAIAYAKSSSPHPPISFGKGA